MGVYPASSYNEANQRALYPAKAVTGHVFFCAIRCESQKNYLCDHK